MEYETTTCPEDEDLIVIPKKFRHIFYGNEDSEPVIAGMANPSKDPEELGLLTVDCGVSTTISTSLFNMTVMTDVEPKVVSIQLAMDGMTVQSTHVENKTYYAYDHTGTIRPITTRAGTRARSFGLNIADIVWSLTVMKMLQEYIRRHRMVQLISQTVSHFLVLGIGVGKPVLSSSLCYFCNEIRENVGISTFALTIRSLPEGVHS